MPKQKYTITITVVKPLFEVNTDVVVRPGHNEQEAECAVKVKAVHFKFICNVSFFFFSYPLRKITSNYRTRELWGFSSNIMKIQGVSPHHCRLWLA